LGCPPIILEYPILSTCPPTLQKINAQQAPPKKFNAQPKKNNFSIKIKKKPSPAHINYPPNEKRGWTIVLGTPRRFSCFS